ncbi:hypothetical protein [Bovifimicola ammoniilytica]|jgi:hypothetical protein|uniref:hypothetical protein n=1 Tax=Bovifimicola ammoniilytica TaxID=2981720 RepID=UPI000822D452|nr:hypothetical protein [Bovifimicola ammoniilytica]MCU6754489.1 hypothetical protein [Bovifimicola ammoniilytica]MDY6328668.1 hypothetical protein [Lachnospiraceae bacterium]SCJ85913.1 Uncharacterised protein [uncultured Eubacterium sp.]
MEMVIQNIITDGYERFVVVNIINNKNLIVHYIEYSEFLEDNEKTALKNIGDIIVSDIKIDLVSNSYITNKKLGFIQEFENSPNIKAIIEVKEVVDEYTIYAQSSLCDESILIEFENKMMYKKYDRVYIEGSLELVDDII